MRIETFEQVDEEARKRANTNGSSKQARGTVPVLTVANVMQSETHKPEMLVEKMASIPGNVLMVAPPKTGKTLGALQMGMSVATGIPLFDYYRVLKRLPPEAGHNVGTRKDLSDYQPYVDQLKAAGPFSSPGRPGETADEARDRISRTARGRNAP